MSVFNHMENMGLFRRISGHTTSSYEDVIEILATRKIRAIGQEPTDKEKTILLQLATKFVEAKQLIDILFPPQQ